MKELQAERETEPSWVRDGFYVKLPMKDKEGRSAYFDLTYIIPFGDLVGGNFLSRDIERETGLKEGVPEAMISKFPAFNLIKELGKNQDFYGNKIFKDSNETEQQLTDILFYLAKFYLPPMVGDQIPSGYRNDNEKRPAQWQQILEGDTGTESGRAQARTLSQHLLRAIGLKINPVDLKTQASFAEWEMEKALRTLLKEEGEVAEFTRPFVPSQ